MLGGVAPSGNGLFTAVGRGDESRIMGSGRAGGGGVGGVRRCEAKLFEEEEVIFKIPFGLEAETIKGIFNDQSVGDGGIGDAVIRGGAIGSRVTGVCPDEDFRRGGFVAVDVIPFTNDIGDVDL